MIIIILGKPNSCRMCILPNGIFVSLFLWCFSCQGWGVWGGVGRIPVWGGLRDLGAGLEGIPGAGLEPSMKYVWGKPLRLSRRIPKPGHAAKGADGPGKHESPGQELPAGTCRNPRIHCQASTGTPGFTARALPSSWACPLSQTSHKASFHIPVGRESINPMDGLGGA